jgi:hypothetical protein
MPEPTAKGRTFFDTGPHPEHVTFDDGRGDRRNFPWVRYSHTRWRYLVEPDVLNVIMADCLIVIVGKNLAPLYHAIETRTLARLCAQPTHQGNLVAAVDSYATEISFLRPVENLPAKGQSQLNLDPH